MNRSAGTLGRISRRGLLGSGAAASVLLASGLAARTEPRRGGTLRIATPGPAADRPWSDSDAFGRLLAPGSLFDALTEVAADGTLHGELAESWSQRDLGRVWVVRLRADVAFHHGVPLGPEDVIASLRPQIRSPGWLRDVCSLRKSGNDQVIFRLESPDPHFPFRLSQPGLVIRPARGPLYSGTGLYRLDAFDPGHRARLIRVSDHHKSAQAGWADVVEVLRLRTPAARIAALLSGRVDIAIDVDPRAAAGLHKRPRFAVTTVPMAREVSVSTRGPGAKALKDALAAVLNSDTPRAAGMMLNGSRITGVALSIAPGADEFPWSARAARLLTRAVEDLGLQLSQSAGGSRVMVALSGNAPAGGTYAEIPLFRAECCIAHTTRVAPLSEQKGGPSSIDRIPERWFFT